MCTSIRGWVVAASVGVVEALKDQGICRWNHTIKSAQQYAKNHVRSVSRTIKLSSSGSGSGSSVSMVSDNKKKQSEESLRMVMYLSCWGPN